jgi:hypothetical protein
LIAALRPMCGEGIGFLIGSLVFGGYSTARSDIDLLTYEDRDGVEYREDADITLPGLGAPVTLAVCRRPLTDWSDPLAVLQARDRGLTSWKEFSAVEDAIMAIGHGVQVAGPPMTVRPAVSGTAFGGYLALRASVLDELSTRGPEWLEETPHQSGPHRFYSKVVVRVAREHGYVVGESAPGHIDQLPDLVGRRAAPPHIRDLVGRAVCSLVGEPDAEMLTEDAATEYLAWVNDCEARHGRDPWAQLISAPAKVRRPIVDLRKQPDIDFDEGSDGQ